MARVSRRELEKTKVDLRHWSEQLLSLANEVNQRASTLEEEMRDGGDNDGGPQQQRRPQ
jgi:hypothetical protein